MAGRLVRFGVAMDGGLVGDFDQLVSERGTTRSALLSDLARAEVSRTKVQGPTRAVATLTLVYDHHVRDLTEKLTEIQHDLGDRVHSTMHVHLDHDRCLEVIVMRGPASVIRAAAERILAARGVLQGGLELIAEVAPPHVHTHTHTHSHSHGHVAAHSHGHSHADHQHVHAPIRKRVAEKEAAPAKATAPRKKAAAASGLTKSKPRRIN